MLLIEANPETERAAKDARLHEFISRSAGAYANSMMMDAFLFGRSPVESPTFTWPKPPVDWSKYSASYDPGTPVDKIIFGEAPLNYETVRRAEQAMKDEAWRQANTYRENARTATEARAKYTSSGRRSGKTAAMKQAAEETAKRGGRTYWPEPITTRDRVTWQFAPHLGPFETQGQEPTEGELVQWQEGRTAHPSIVAGECYRIARVRHDASKQIGNNNLPSYTFWVHPKPLN